MRVEDAIKTLKELWRETNDSWYEEVYKMAIDALEAGRKTKPQNCEECPRYKFSDDRGYYCEDEPQMSYVRAGRGDE